MNLPSKGQPSLGSVVDYELLYTRILCKGNISVRDAAPSLYYPNRVNTIIVYIKIYYLNTTSDKLWTFSTCCQTLILRRHDEGIEKHVRKMQANRSARGADVFEVYRCPWYTKNGPTIFQQDNRGNSVRDHNKSFSSCFRYPAEPNLQGNYIYKWMCPCTER